MDFAKLASQLTANNERRAYVRMLLRRTDAGWILRHAWMLVGAEPPGWIAETWQYAEVTLVACTVSAADLAIFCLDDGRGRATLGKSSRCAGIAPPLSPDALDVLVNNAARPSCRCFGEAGMGSWSGPPRVLWRPDLPRIYRHATIGRRCQ